MAENGRPFIDRAASKVFVLSVALVIFGALGLFAQETSPNQVSPQPTAAAQVRGQDALQAYRQRQYQAAIDITLREIQTNPDSMDSYAVLGWSLNALRRYQDAIRYSQEARRRNASDHRMIGILAEAHYALKNDSSAIAFYQQYIAITSRLEGYDTRYIRDAYRDLGEIFIRIGEFHHADIAYTSSILYDTGKSALDPSRHGRLWVRLAFAREQIGDVEQAKAAYEKALASDPSSVEARSGLDRLRLAGSAAGRSPTQAPVPGT